MASEFQIHCPTPQYLPCTCTAARAAAALSAETYLVTGGGGGSLCQQFTFALPPR